MTASMSWSVGWEVLQQRRRLHDLARLAVAALRHLKVDPGLLHGMRALGIEPFDRRDLGAGHRATGVMQERVGRPSTCTVQAPHMPMPQPNLVPVRPTSSRITHSSGVSSSASTVTARPLM